MIPLAFVSCALVGTAVWLGGFPEHVFHRRTAIEELRSSAEALPYRVIDGRLWGFSRRPRGASQSIRASLVGSAVRGTRPALSETESLHIDGVARLLRGDVDKAISMLTKAATQDRGNPTILNDLSAAHMERAVRQMRGRDLIDAFELSDRALRLDPASREAAFNRALAIERLGLRSEAAAAWQMCRRRDAESGWAEEDAEHVRRLTAPTYGKLWEQLVDRFDQDAANGNSRSVEAIVRLYPQQVRSHFEEDLCGLWAEAANDGKQPKSDRLLGTLRTVAAALASVTANPLPARTIAVIDGAKNDPKRLAHLVDGHLAYRRAMGFYRAVEITRGEPLLQQSENLLRGAGSPFAVLPLFYRASSRSYENDIDGALRLLDQTERDLTVSGMTSSPAYGHVLWVRGRSLLKRGFPHASLNCFKRALDLFLRNGELESVAALHDLLAYNDAFLGEDDDAWTHYVAAVNLVEHVGARRRERTILHGLAGFAMSRALLRTALLYTSMLVRLAVEDADAGDHARALLDRSREFHAVGNMRAADNDIRRARILSDKVPDRGMRDELYADLSAAEATVGSEDYSDDPLAPFDRAIAIATQVEKETLLPRLWTERARAARAANRIDEAERSLREGIAVIERHRWTVGDRDLQIAFAEQWYSAFDDMIDLLVAAGRPAEALSFAERSRAQVLFDEINAAQPAADRALPEPTAANIPIGHAVLVYSSLDRSTVLWLVRRDGMSCRRLAVGKADLDRMVAGCQPKSADPSDTDDALRICQAALYDAVIRPVAADLRPGERLIFVPDKSLQSAPFAALYDRTRRRWLIEEHVIGVTPSVRLFLAALDRDSKLLRLGSDRVLTVGDPAFDRTRFPKLPRLAAANEEARQVARLYKESTILTGAQATPARFKAESRGCPIVHVATHALANSQFPSWSALLLSPEPSSSSTGILYGFEIDRRTFGSTRLVVLAGCDTGSGRQTRYEGTLGLARSFMTAGVPNVVSTLWQIDDDASRKLLLRFHQRLRAGDDALTALQAAQLALIHSPDKALRRVAAWAGFQMFGGVFQQCPSVITKEKPRADCSSASDKNLGHRNRSPHSLGQQSASRSCGRPEWDRTL